MTEQLKTSEVSTISSFIWNIADNLWGDFTHADFDRIIMPLLLLRRLECILEATREKVLEEYENEKDSGIDLELILPEYSGYPFYNTSNYTLDTLGSTNTKSNLELSHTSLISLATFVRFSKNSIFLTLLQSLITQNCFISLLISSRISTCIQRLFQTVLCLTPTNN